MRRVVAICALAILISACNEGGTSTEQKLDSLEQKIDTTLDKAADSIKVKAQLIKNKVRQKWKDARDSSNRKDSVNL